MALTSPAIEPDLSVRALRGDTKPLLRSLERDDTLALKGIGIIAIVLHNFFHAVSPVHQNEFRFHPHAFAVFLQTVVHPSLAVQAFFSFFGHFGVQIFIFLSAFGLARVTGTIRLGGRSSWPAESGSCIQCSG